MQALLLEKFGAKKHQKRKAMKKRLFLLQAGFVGGDVLIDFARPLGERSAKPFTPG
ncbi:hypothetical protein ACO7_510135 [Thiomonas arsenitoxydans]|nr:hypothetical protein THICB6_20194 [Thiomonas arsenitoxydans]CQR37751.1 hypothetical protein ACO7_510135 [Thiomonas arsenitoxydans]